MQQKDKFEFKGHLARPPAWDRACQLAQSHPWAEPQLARPAPLDMCSVIFYNHFSTEPLSLYQGILGWYSPQDQQLIEATLPLIEAMRDQFFPDCQPVKGEISYIGPNLEQGQHVDPRYFHKIAHRAHLCLTTCEGAYLEVEQDRQHIQVGEVWTFNNLLPHRSINEGSGSRVHMIIDFAPKTVWQDWCKRYGEKSLYTIDPEGRAANMLLFTNKQS